LASGAPALLSAMARNSNNNVWWGRCVP
jgi:hypothetical protein